MKDEESSRSEPDSNFTDYLKTDLFFPSLLEAFSMFIIISVDISA